MFLSIIQAIMWQLKALDGFVSVYIQINITVPFSTCCPDDNILTAMTTNLY